MLGALLADNLTTKTQLLRTNTLQSLHARVRPDIEVTIRVPLEIYRFGSIRTQRCDEHAPSSVVVAAATAMFLGLAVLAAALAGSGVRALATPALHKRFGEPAVKHAWAEVPDGWDVDEQGVPPADHMINLRIGLKQHKIDVLIEQLYDVSDPASAAYGKHLSKEQVEALVAPHADTVAIVEDWLAAHGIPAAHCSRSPSGDWLSVSVPVSTAERLFDTTYHVFRRRDTGNRVVRTLSYSLPRALHDHIDVVAPTTMFGSLHEMRATSFVQPAGFQAVTPDAEPERLVRPGRLATLPASCSTTITPTCLRILYATDTYVPAATATNKLGVAGYLAEVRPLR